MKGNQEKSISRTRSPRLSPNADAFSINLVRLDGATGYREDKPLRRMGIFGPFDYLEKHAGTRGIYLLEGKKKWI